MSFAKNGELGNINLICLCWLQSIAWYTNQENRLASYRYCMVGICATNVLRTWSSTLLSEMHWHLADKHFCFGTKDSCSCRTITVMTSCSVLYNSDKIALCIHCTRICQKQSRSGHSDGCEKFACDESKPHCTVRKPSLQWLHNALWWHSVVFWNPR